MVERKLVRNRFSQSCMGSYTSRSSNCVLCEEMVACRRKLMDNSMASLGGAVSRDFPDLKYPYTPCVREMPEDLLDRVWNSFRKALREAVRGPETPGAGKDEGNGRVGPWECLRRAVKGPEGGVEKK